MSATVTTTPASGSITAVVTAIRVTCDDVPGNTSDGYDAANYPASPAVNYRFEFSLTGQDTLVSPVFSTNADGVAEWNGILIPAAGTWTLDAVDTSDDSVAATAQVIVN